MSSEETTTPRVTANPGYAAFQIAKALTTSETHIDAQTREQAFNKVKQWQSVIDGMMCGRFTVGSRQPMPDLPVWVTPEVVTGGFVTGNSLAGGPLLPHEHELLKRIPDATATSERQAINTFFLTEEGFAELAALLSSGCYDITVPEEGAMLTIVWLATNGQADAARSLVDIIAPHFSALRFYPLPAKSPPVSGARIYLERVGETQEKIRRIQPNAQIMVQREAINVWIPLYDRMIGLFMETVAGDIPVIQPDTQGRWVSPATGKFLIAGGWPCRNYPLDWRERAAQLGAECDRMRSRHKMCSRPDKAGDSFARLHSFLKQCVDDADSLTGRDVGMIRLILARHVAKRGKPQSEKFQQLRKRQAVQVTGPTFHELAQVVAERLEAHPPESGLDTVDSITRPVSQDEAGNFHIPKDTPIPASICRKVDRCLCDTADVLVELGIITSGDTLARVIPQFTSNLKAASFEDIRLRRLYSNVYRAFRQRRSLLLLNMEKQVQLQELPWISAVESFRRSDPSTREVSAQVLKELALLTLRSFPHAIIPNKLLQEFRSLAKDADLKLPLVEELAADIFMDDFSPKFTLAAKRAAELLGGSLYARYYKLDVGAVSNLPEAELEPKKSWFNQNSSPKPNPLVTMCIQRSGVDPAVRWDVVRNGMVIEQAQILTTHNLATLYSGLNLAEDLCDALEDMTKRCFQWICQRHQMKIDKPHAKLIMLKNTAYAWRQMVFYLSQLSNGQRQNFFDWANEYLGKQSDGFRFRFAPVLRDLTISNDASLEHSRYFTGWSKTRHWLLA